MRILLFGATGSAGGSVLKACLASSDVTEVRVIVRRPPRQVHEKLQVFLHNDFLDYRAVTDAFVGVDFCFFCLGVSITAVSAEAEYRRITQDFAIAAARMLRAYSPRAAFHYLSAHGAHRRSPFLWARVKAETDEKLIDLVEAVCWRPSAIDGEATDHAPRFYRMFRPYVKIFRRFRHLYVSGADLGKAMLYVAASGTRTCIISNPEIRDLADRVNRASLALSVTALSCHQFH